MLSHEPSATTPYQEIVLASSQAKALSVRAGINRPTFHVMGSGRVDTRGGMDIRTAEYRALVVTNGEDDERRLEVTNAGKITTKQGLKIQSDYHEPLSFYTPTGGVKFKLNSEGTVKAYAGIDVEDGGITINGGGDAYDFRIVNGAATNFKIKNNGFVWAREITVTAESIPDYVFRKDYDLMPLSELESYINREKHLPNIPSEKEVKENGLSLGDQQMRQLEKIEELTLYVIEINKKLENLQDQNAELKRQLNEHSE